MLIKRPIHSPNPSHFLSLLVPLTKSISKTDLRYLTVTFPVENITEWKELSILLEEKGIYSKFFKDTFTATW